MVYPFEKNDVYFHNISVSVVQININVCFQKKERRKTVEQKLLKLHADIASIVSMICLNNSKVYRAKILTEKMTKENKAGKKNERKRKIS